MALQAAVWVETVMVAVAVLGMVRQRRRRCWAPARLVEMRTALDASLIAHRKTANESDGEEKDSAANSACSELNSEQSTIETNEIAGQFSPLHCSSFLVHPMRM